jgi:glycosyltransferase involved in cell wall biosynthesis
MKLVFLAPFAFTPKATVSARMLPIARTLAVRRHQVHIVMPPYDNASDSGKIWQTEGVQLENLRLRGAPESARTLLDLAAQMQRRVRELQPDVIHVFKPIGVAALAQWHLHRDFAKRTVVDNDDWEGRGGWLDVNPYPRLQKLFFAWQERWSLRAAARVTCASDVLVQRSNTFRGASDSLIFPNGPDPALAQPIAVAQAHRDSLRENLGWTAQQIAIYTGTIPLNHDLDVALDAACAIPSCKLVFIASGAGVPAFKAAVMQAGLGERAEFYDFMPHEQMLRYLVAADVAIYPYRDTNINRAKCSGKVMDYMACARPMVLSAVGMNRVYAEDGISALLTAPGDAQAFGNALKRLLSSPAEAAVLGAAAQQRIWDVFGWDKRIGALEELYRTVSAQANA